VLVFSPQYARIAAVRSIGGTAMGVGSRGGRCQDILALCGPGVVLPHRRGIPNAGDLQGIQRSTRITRGNALAIGFLPQFLGSGCGDLENSNEIYIIICTSSLA